MKILIVGGGIAGCTLAFFLKKYGFTPTVIESAPEFKRVGYLLGFRETGLEVAEKIGVLNTLKQQEIPFTETIWKDIHGKMIKIFDTNKVLTEFSGLALNRFDLHMCLFEAIKKTVDFRFDQQLTEIQQDKEGVTGWFKNGKKEKFDIVIGADGFHSNIRKLIFGNEFTRYLGQAFFAFIVPNRTKNRIVEKRNVMNIRGPDFWLSYGLFSRSENEVGSYVIHRAEPYIPIDPKKRREYLLHHYGKYDKSFRHILETMTDDDFIYHGDLSQVVMPTWQKGRVCLIGDAAYCLTLASGMGASMAMAGAYILAKKINELREYKKAFVAYEAKMRPDILRLQGFGQRIAKFIVGESILPYEFMNTVLRFTPVYILTRVILRQSNQHINLD